MQTDQVVNVENILNKLLGVVEKAHMLIPIFQDHNNQIKTLLGRVHKGNYDTLYTASNNTIDFLKWKYNVTDIDIRKIDHPFITEFEFYLGLLNNSEISQNRLFCYGINQKCPFLINRVSF